MNKTASLALGAFAVAAISGAALAQDATAHETTAPAHDGAKSDLSTAITDVSGSAEDLGFNAFAPAEHTGHVKDQVGTIDLKYTPSYRYEEAGDLNKNGGDISVDRWGSALRMDYHAEDDALWTFRWGYERSNYDISGGRKASVADEALDNATVWSLTLAHLRPINEEWSAFAGFGLQFGGADDVSFSDGSNFMGAVGAIRKHDETLSYGLGILVREDFEDSAIVLPLPIVTWQIDERSALRVKGLKVDYSYDVEHDLTAHAFLDYELRSYRIDKDPKFGAASDGSVDDTHWLLGVGLDWKPRDVEWLTVSGEIGAILGQKFEVQDSDGSEVTTNRMDDNVGFFVGLSATLSF